MIVAQKLKRNINIIFFVRNNLILFGLFLIERMYVTIAIAINPRDPSKTNTRNLSYLLRNVAIAYEIIKHI